MNSINSIYWCALWYSNKFEIRNNETMTWLQTTSKFEMWYHILDCIRIGRLGLYCIFCPHKIVRSNCVIPKQILLINYEQNELLKIPKNHFLGSSSFPRDMPSLESCFHRILVVGSIKSHQTLWTYLLHMHHQ